MIEVDRWLIANADLLGITTENVNPHSVDLCLGGHIKEFADDGDLVDEFELEPGQKIQFHPGAFYLCHTLEHVHVPETHRGQMFLKSSTARKGLNMLMSGYVDAGWEGQLTAGFTPFMPFVATIGQRIIQLEYLRLSEMPAKPYGMTGRYQGSTGATEAKQ